MRPCVICELRDPGQIEAGDLVGVRTADDAILARAVESMRGIAGEQHVLVPACPRHVAMIYRSRVPGVAMAWRFLEDAAMEKAGPAA